MIALVVASSAYIPVPCVRVAGAGMSQANGLYAAETLESYVGPATYHKPGTDYWMYRWHQTFWYLSILQIDTLTSEDAFVKLVVYTAMAERSEADGVSPAPPKHGWTGDVMRGWGPAPFPHVSKVRQCLIRADGSLELMDSPEPPTDEATAPANDERLHILDETYEIKRTAATAAACIIMMATLLVAYGTRRLCCWRSARRRPLMKFCPAVPSDAPIILSGGSLVIMPVAVPV
jgi:hypothetical protein